MKNTIDKFTINTKHGPMIVEIEYEYLNDWTSSKPGPPMQKTKVETRVIASEWLTENMAREFISWFERNHQEPGHPPPSWLGTYG